MADPRAIEEAERYVAAAERDGLAFCSRPPVRPPDGWPFQVVLTDEQETSLISGLLRGYIAKGKGWIVDWMWQCYRVGQDMAAIYGAMSESKIGAPAERRPSPANIAPPTPTRAGEKKADWLTAYERERDYEAEVEREGGGS